VRLEDAAHEDGGAATPDTGLDEVARDVVAQDRLHRELDVVQALEPDHRLRTCRPVQAVLAAVGVVRPALADLDAERREATSDRGGRP
jgi:hypothetical protein